MYHHILLVTKVTIGYHAYQSNSISKDIDVIHTNVISFLYVDYNPSPPHPPKTAYLLTKVKFTLTLVQILF